MSYTIETNKNIREQYIIISYEVHSNNFSLIVESIVGIKIIILFIFEKKIIYNS